MNTATEALDLLKKYEDIRQQAIEELETAMADIESKLNRLRGEIKTPQKKVKPERPRVCKVCGSTEHDGRFHKSNQKAGAPSSAATQAA
jgi:ribosomal protein L29